MAGKDWKVDASIQLRSDVSIVWTPTYYFQCGSGIELHDWVGTK